ncbi:MAG: hypothetical protein HQM03_06020 [Magnetococcales bacterium]|nr:hypothetical protein [Magnetococcales bacterium]
MTIATIGNNQTQAVQPVTVATQTLPGEAAKPEGIAPGSTTVELTDPFAARVQGINRAIQNLNDGIAAAQLAHAGVEDLLHGMGRLQALTFRIASGPADDRERAGLQKEADLIQKGMNDTVAGLQFNGVPLLASGAVVTLPGEGDQRTLTLPALAGVSQPIDLSSQNGAQRAIGSLAANQRILADAREQLAERLTSLASLSDTLTNTRPGPTSATGRLTGADMAQASAATSSTIRDRAAMAIRAQANQTPSQVQGLL